jgi:hypothetical protein
MQKHAHDLINSCVYKSVQQEAVRHATADHISPEIQMCHFDGVFRADIRGGAVPVAWFLTYS